MILSKIFEHFTDEYDFTEGIVSEIKWDSNLLDLLVVVYYYWDKKDGRSENRDLTIRFKNCRQASFTMTKCFEMIPKNELKDYINSWYTITHCSAEESNGLIEVSIKTIDNNPKWLTVKCEEIWIEGEK